MAVDRTRLPEVAPARPFRLPVIETRVGDNGLTIRTVEHAVVPLVSVTLLIRGGASADPAGAAGLSALAGDLLDEGTGAEDAIAMSDRLSRIGARAAISTGPDATTLSISVLERHAEAAIDWLADVVRRPALRESDLDRIRQQRLARLQQLRDMPSAVADEAFLRRVYGSHPYGHLSIGDEAGLRAADLAAVEAMYRQRCQPGNTVVVAGGARSHDALARLVERGFGDWPGGPPAAAVDALVSRQPEENHTPLVLVARPGAPQSQLRVGVVAAPRTTVDYAPLVVMNAVLGGEFTSRLNLRLREEKAVTYGARTDFDWRCGPSLYLLRTSVEAAATAEALEETLKEFEAIRGERAVTGEELDLAKAALTRGYPREYETVDQVVRSVARLALYGLPDETLETFVPAVEAVSVAEVTRVAGPLLARPRLSVVAVGDPDVVAASLGELGLGPVEIEPAPAPR